MKVFRTTAFIEWYLSVEPNIRLRVDARVERAEIHPNLILLLGGNKNGQDKDIRKAKRILNEINFARLH